MAGEHTILWGATVVDVRGGSAHGGLKIDSR
jgi:hypothetical protein